MNPPDCFPGTRVPISEAGLLEGIFTATNGITLSQVCEITGLEAGTIQNWVKRGYVNPPAGRKYSKGQLARIILIGLLRETFIIERIAGILSYVNGNLLDKSDDIMDDSDIYKCLCDVLAAMGSKVDDTVENLGAEIDQKLAGFREPYTGAKDKLKLALRAMACAYYSAEFKRAANQLTKCIQEK